MTREEACKARRGFGELPDCPPLCREDNFGALLIEVGTLYIDRLAVRAGGEGRETMQASQVEGEEAGMPLARGRE